MLRIKELSFSFGELTVLNNINAAVEPGKLYGRETPTRARQPFLNVS